ncbi:MAG: substrate-binding domain-containing protein [Anaerolineae bacterium]|nr:substrate-binding domain-containing protein [Anaerolineae bacterium]
MSAQTQWPVDLDPALGWMRPAMNACARQFPDKNLIVNERETAGDAPLYLSWGETPDPENASIFELGGNDFAVIVNRDNPVNEISYHTLAAIYSGKINNWQEIDSTLSNQVPLEVWQYEFVSSLYERFSIMSDLAGARGGVQQLAPDPKTMLEAVQTNPAAIGWVPAGWVKTDVKRLIITDSPPEKMFLPILAYLKEKPDDFETAWLLCLQQ